MKKRFSDEQIISILREAEAGVPAVNSAASMPFPMPRFTPGVRSMAVWRCLKLSA
ncbi:IS3 family transposase orfA [Enterobacter cloacae]|uniref:IS3 family transposase orfA n=1 Tax=Enterobacter cloacae TaxID=550 RepID=A0A377M5W2_ENTCL|nr:IS3 family transposase orfA [Enterobacter cloacae]